MIQIPIRSIFIEPLEQDSNEIDRSIYQKINRIFYPNADEHFRSTILSKPIVILWWYRRNTTEKCPDHVVPLFPMGHPVSRTIFR